MKKQHLDIRRDILKLSKITGQGRLGTDYSVVELISTVYNRMKHDPKNPDWEHRDIFILSKGHASLSYYTILSHNGYFSLKDIETLKSYKSKFGGHPDRIKIPGVEASTGSLGHGIGLAVGMALAFKITNSDREVYVLVGDGESNEGTVWESIMIAVNEKLDNLNIIFDVNKSQTRGLQLNNISGVCTEFGCLVGEVDGHDIDQIEYAFRRKQKDKPNVIVANTLKGYPCKTLIDNKFEWHSKVPNDEYYNIFMGELDEKAI